MQESKVYLFDPLWALALIAMRDKTTVDLDHCCAEVLLQHAALQRYK